MRTDAARLRAVAALYPPTDLLALDRAEQRAGIARIVRDFLGAEAGDAPQRWRDASPIEHVHGAQPPIFILQGTRDLLVPASQATRFAERLAAAGAPHRLEIVEGGLHGFDRIAPDARAVGLIGDVRAFLREKLG